MDSRVLLTLAVVLPLAMLAAYGLYRVADERAAAARPEMPGNVQSLSDWAFPAVG